MLLFFSLTIFIYNTATSQIKYWSLEECITYATAHNVSVQQADVQARISALQLEQSKAAKIPTLSFSTNAGGQFGRSISFVIFQIRFAVSFLSEAQRYNDCQ
ncbi:TolC family protein [Haoranjiania flava]|uniref:TolC family protein n=2 Tax=Haoranjiania flava TaxID=1856322 RepID=A0AAE3IL72_9BACT|nr:TolC family protein [Haoranjiania flava]MCU7694225.1 TolC family protein [Haoranjiania flava]